MKSIKRILIGTVIIGSLAASLHLLHAQETAMPVQAAATSLPAAGVDWSAASDLEVMLLAVEMTPTVSAASMPRFGTFYSAQHAPGTRLAWPPLPGNSRQVPAWNLGDGVYLLDDLTVNYSQPVASAAMTGGGMMGADGPEPPGGGGTNDGGGFYSDSFQPPVYTTNDLWLQMVGTTNNGTAMTASLVINTPWNVSNGVYDLFATTNLAPSAWQWLGRCSPGQTNLAVANLASPTEFFILGLTNDADGDGLTDAYEQLVSHTDPNNADSSGDGMLDGWKVLWGLSLTSNNWAQSGERSNYTYDPVGRLQGVSGVRSGSISPDAEGNVQTVSQ